MRVSLEDVDHIALLARVGLTDDERAAMRSDLEAILGYIAKLEQLDTDAVEPTAHVAELTTPLRDDRATNPEAPEAMVGNAPDRDRNFIRVPKIIE
ncbi:MAG TPA: Asp-tRNA(Asn)/Glu-tRNA(Gln) amidotransferase subunit GatC [Candidatus Bathyarchaeia archaeon]|nr:Asp-tRNA(Asn)/Glu-tRNA(Gln) amidotransferase subunit GatC [Candidatus Bathyarchaeia archaeon]